MTRELFEQQLSEMRDQVTIMGSQVAEELQTALAALGTLDCALASQVPDMDRIVNQIRFAIEDMCFTVIATQQPTARDLRLVFAVANMIVDLERMGDQAKGIAKLIPDLAGQPTLSIPAEIQQMGRIVSQTLGEALRAHAERDIVLAEQALRRDQEVDALYAAVFAKVMLMMVQADTPETARAAHGILRVGRELERFGDLATNVAERCIYLITGAMPGPQTGV